MTHILLTGSFNLVNWNKSKLQELFHKTSECAYVRLCTINEDRQNRDYMILEPSHPTNPFAVQNLLTI